MIKNIFLYLIYFPLSFFSKSRKFFFNYFNNIPDNIYLISLHNFMDFNYDKISLNVEKHLFKFFYEDIYTNYKYFSHTEKENLLNTLIKKVPFSSKFIYELTLNNDYPIHYLQLFSNEFNEDFKFYLLEQDPFSLLGFDEINDKHITFILDRGDYGNLFSFVDDNWHRNLSEEVIIRTLKDNQNLFNNFDNDIFDRFNEYLTSCFELNWNNKRLKSENILNCLNYGDYSKLITDYEHLILPFFDVKEVKETVYKRVYDMCLNDLSNVVHNKNIVINKRFINDDSKAIVLREIMRRK